MIAKLELAHKPTPLWRSDAIDELVGTRVWIKRDDMTAGAAAGNKIRKLEYLLADALAQGADTLVTCGAVQSNHARATAILGRQLGLRSTLLLRSASPDRSPELTGNLLLDRLVGASVQLISPEQYADRERLMSDVAAALASAGRKPYVIPEGGSNGLGSLGYVDAMREVARQLADGDADGEPFDAVVHACGSGGTAAGIQLGGGHCAQRAIAIAVCDSVAYFNSKISSIIEDAKQHCHTDTNPIPGNVVADYRGPAYGVPSQAQVTFIRQAARHAGLLLDPVYTGKALWGLSQLKDKPARCLFIHTGGLPGLLAGADLFADAGDVEPSVAL